MFKKAIFLVLSALISVGGIFVARVEAMQLSDQKKQALLTLEKVRKYEKSIGISPLLDFTNTEKEDSTVSVYYQKKTDMAFSYLDPLLMYRPALPDSSKPLGIWLPPEIDISQYDFFLYSPEATSEGLKSFKSLAEADTTRAVYVVIHEDWHNNVNLPLHIEEASGDLVGEVGSAEFMGMDIDGRLQNSLRYGNMVNNCYGELRKISELYMEWKISIDTYEIEKENIYKKYKGFDDRLSNSAFIALSHTYSYYFPLMYKLFIAKGKSLKRTVEFLKSIKIKEPVWQADGELYFKETLEAEVKIEKIIEEEIRRLK